MPVVIGDLEPAVLSPSPRVLIDGQDPPGLAQNLISLKVTHALNGPSRCEARFLNWGQAGGQADFLYFGEQVLDFGRGVRIEQAGRTLFSGAILALEADFPEGRAPELVLHAEDHAEALRTPRTRTFHDVTDGDVIRQIANDHGLAVASNLDGPRHPVLAQMDQSDLAFLRGRARLAGADLWLEGDTLHVQTLLPTSAGTLSLTLGNELRRFNVTADLANQPTRVVVGGWDVEGKSELRAQADDTLLQGELGSDRSAASIVQRAFGERPYVHAGRVPLNLDEAISEAFAEFTRRSRRFVLGHGTTGGGVIPQVGQWVKVDRLGPLFSGRYFVTDTAILFDPAAGLRTEFRVERPGLGLP